MVAADAPLLVRDAHADDRFADNPLVIGEPRVRFYAGMPLRTPAGLVVGTLCAIDHEPRELTPIQLEMLGLLAEQVVAQLELRRHNLALAATTKQLETYRTFFDLTLALFVTVDPQLHIRNCNPAWSALLGWTPEELRAVPLTDFVHPDDVAATLLEAGRLRREATPTVHQAMRYTRGELRDVYFYPDQRAGKIERRYQLRSWSARRPRAASAAYSSSRAAPTLR